MSLANIGESRIGERLVLLTLQGSQVITRLYDIKQYASEMCKLVYEEKPMESVIKYVVKKFPNWEYKHVPSSNHIKANAGDILKDIKMPIDMLRDLLDFKERTLELFNIIAAAQLEFDVTYNYDMCRLYMDILTLYCQVMFLLPRVQDVKVLLGVYHVCVESISGTVDTFIPRIANIVQGHEQNMFKRLHEDMNIFHRPIIQCVTSAGPVMMRRLISAEQMQNQNTFNLFNNPNSMRKATQYNLPAVEFINIDAFVKWTMFGFFCCTGTFVMNDDAMALVRMILTDQYCLTLFRDEVLPIGPALEGAVKAAKVPKLEKAFAESLTAAITTSPATHKGRRDFLRGTLKEWYHLISDKPGLLGPKAPLVLQMLSMTKDEVLWLCRHQDAPIPKQAKGKVHAEDFQDPHLAELLFYHMEMMLLIKKHPNMIRRYYCDFLINYDKENIIAQRNQLGNEGDEHGCVESMLASLNNLSSTRPNFEDMDYKPPSLAAIRLDWIRTQIFTSQNPLGNPLRKAPQFCIALHNTTFHTNMVDKLLPTIDEISDLGMLVSYHTVLDRAFQDSLGESQGRFSIAIPYICAQFCGENLRYCPEELAFIGAYSVKLVNSYLEQIADTLGKRVLNLAEDFITMNAALLPHNALLLADSKGKRIKSEAKKKGKEAEIFDQPGLESYRVRREALSKSDEKLYGIMDLCYALNLLTSLDVWKHTFVPREYAIQPLQAAFMVLIFAQLELPVVPRDKDVPEVRRPTVLLNAIKGILNMLRMIENFLNIDVVRIFNAVLLQHAQDMEINSQPTICHVYSSWYNTVLMKRICAGTGCFATNRHCFVSRGKEVFQAEMYTDPTELKALCELVGAYGIRHIGDECIDLIVSQVNEIKKLLITNKDLLHNIRGNSDKIEVCCDWIKKLNGTEELLQRLTIVGTILNFRKLLFSAMKEVLNKRVPFVMNSVIDFKEHYSGSDKALEQLDYLAITAGLECIVDPKLKSALVTQCDVNQQDYLLWCLMLIFVGVGLPTLASNDQSQYQPSLAGYENNIHCISTAVNQLSAAIFTIIGYCTIQERMHEFLAVATAHLLRLGQENEKDARHRDSIYILLHRFVEESPFLTMNLLETCFPYIVLRNSYNIAYKPKKEKKRREEESTY
ncbi:nck-associated protein 1-like isoform X2 [Sycon ciliatum]|uniref:nck-associated protein 1-like isoform X2 n=1 Tax=Sycon ciliatum TaxID=27933 RepID=UPI0031F69FDC